MTNLQDPTAPVPASKWHGQLAQAALGGTLDRAGQMAMVRFRDIDPLIDQPAMRDHVIAMHLGGSKRVTRSSGRTSQTFVVDENSLTVMPAFEAYRWQTDGPIDFVHVTLSQSHLGQIAVEEFDREPSQLTLRPIVGAGDPLITSLCHALLMDLERPDAGVLYRESLLIALSYNVACRFSNMTAEPAGQPAKGGLAGWQLRRVVDYMRMHMARDITLDQLVGLTGLSRAQFFRAFGRSIGRSPYAYLTDLRVRRARELLGTTTMPIGDVAARVGLNGPQFSAAFRKRVGQSPSLYRREVARSPY